MSIYRARENADFFSEYNNGFISSKVAGVRAGDTIEATDLFNGVLKISPTRWTRKRWFELVPETDPPEYPPPPPPSGDASLFQFLPSANPRESAQKLNSAPDVTVLFSGWGRVVLIKEWQLYLRKINPRMTANHVAALLGSNKAFTNNTGFATFLNPTQRRNYITNATPDERLPLPEFDKDRTCGFACHRAVVEGDFIRVTTLDGNHPPPSLSEKNPGTHPHLYFHATLVYSGGSIRPFPNAAPAPEWGYTRNVVLIPLVATHPIIYPRSLVIPATNYRLPYTI